MYLCCTVGGNESVEGLAVGLKVTRKASTGSHRCARTRLVGTCPYHLGSRNEVKCECPALCALSAWCISLCATSVALIGYICTHSSPAEMLCISSATLSLQAVMGQPSEWV